MVLRDLSPVRFLAYSRESSAILSPTLFRSIPYLDVRQAHRGHSQHHSENRRERQEVESDRAQSRHASARRMKQLMMKAGWK
jgi:hypothetical protein